ncbi:peptide deformylase [Mycolicibacterium goodii]|uniref:peptide deformylase n=2 Tax=Mycolicibacterium goodii TaxID=134601 RepID=UPI001BDD61B5|nr:peptide deformylase [Mycolicibacterium goodii]MBU8809817.1 peptide deformylase [Mycolicibacterium goodii]ULN49506.1 peptide deformylase [Mycolicibacterium goodii]
MTVLPIRVVGDSILGMATTPLPVVDGPKCLVGERGDLIADMRETLARSGGVGLSANQIGFKERIFVYDCPEAAGRPERRAGVVINAVLTRSNVPLRMPDANLDVEACLSVPGLKFPVVRSERAEVRGFDEDGEPVVVAGSGVFARMLQHETDHLDGRLYIDRLVGPHAERAEKSLIALSRSEWGRPGATWTPGVDRHPFKDG